ncbi:hypothetical protein DFJ77DRAFT_276726 [Powellomyces hirtus]|nr:hypothetical protein DFJ77DRAFT_276726 [Powellomyces hirtus]
MSFSPTNDTSPENIPLPVSPFDEHHINTFRDVESSDQQGAAALEASGDSKASPSDIPEPAPIAMVDDDSDDEERPLAALLPDEEDDEEVPLSRLIQDQDEEEIPLAALLSNATAPNAHSTNDDYDDDDVPLNYEGRPTSVYSGGERSGRGSGTGTGFGGGSSQFQWSGPASEYSASHLDPNMRSAFDALFNVRVAPFIDHIRRLEMQIVHLSTQMEHVQEFLRGQAPQVQLGPGRFLAQQEDPAEMLSKRMSKAIHELGKTNPSAVTRKAELGSGLLADMPVRINYLSNGDLNSGPPNLNTTTTHLNITSHRGIPKDPDAPVSYDLASERVECWKCKGRGWEHGHPTIKHKAASADTRCKKCNDCGECGGSGMLHDRYTCRDCDARGFTHPAGLALHTAPYAVRCQHCVECATCLGRGITDTPPKAADIGSTNKRRTIMMENKRRTMMFVQPPANIPVEEEMEHNSSQEDALNTLADAADEDIRVLEAQGGGKHFDAQPLPTPSQPASENQVEQPRSNRILSI